MQGEIVVVSTRANDLKDSDRFSNIANAANRHDWRGRVNYVDCSRSDLAQLFELPDMEEHAGEISASALVPDSAFVTFATRQMTPKQVEEVQR